jgi:hypothetical protein
MIKIIKPVFFFLMQLFVFQGVYCQETKNLTGYLNEKFTHYIKSVPREEIYIHSDRDEYMSGEDLWFNIYLFDRLSTRLSNNSKVVYFELLNKDNRPIVQKKVLLEDGTGPGQIVLPDTLGTGIYTIRAYTNWMKNFLPYNCFMKEIRIYNSFSNRTIRSNSVKDKPPESGSNTISTFNQTGITLSVNNRDTAFLSVIINSNENFRNQNGNQIYLFIQTHGIINSCSQEMITGETTKISVPGSKLIPGINQITIFNAAGVPVGEKLVFTPEPENNQFVSIRGTDTTRRRSEVTLTMDFGEQIITGTNSTFSISVSPITDHHSIADLGDYIVFGSEFGTFPATFIAGRNLCDVDISQTDSLLEHLRSNWIDWNIILSDDLPVYRYKNESENVFLSGRLVSGDQKKREAGKYILMSVPGKTAVFQFTRTDEEGNFNFNIPIEGGTKDLIIQPDEITKNQSINIQSPFSDKYLSPVKSGTKEAQNPEYIPSWSINHQMMKIYSILSANEPVAPSLKIRQPKRFYGKPDKELIMKDYITLPTMQEVFFELIPGVSLENKKTEWNLILDDPLTKHPYEVTAGFFVDGVKVKDASLIAGLDPEKVEKIDVVRRKYYYGDYLFNGVVNIITKAGDFSSVTLPGYALRIPFRVVDPVVEFRSPSYPSAESRKSHIADFRNTLFWSPAERPDHKGSDTIRFWSSDYVSDFEVNIQGITPDGKAFSLKKLIKVRK